MQCCVSECSLLRNFSFGNKEQMLTDSAGTLNFVVNSVA